MSLEPVQRTVIWDSSCDFCRRSAQVGRWLDWTHQYCFVGSAEPGALADQRVTQADVDRAVQLLTPLGRYEGYDAIRRILLRCPPTRWLAPVLWLPPVRILGERVYAWVATRRTCHIGDRHKDS